MSHRHCDWPRCAIWDHKVSAYSTMDPPCQWQSLQSWVQSSQSAGKQYALGLALKCCIAFASCSKILFAYVVTKHSSSEEKGSFHFLGAQNLLVNTLLVWGYISDLVGTSSWWTTYLSPAEQNTVFRKLLLELFTGLEYCLPCTLAQDLGMVLVCWQPVQSTM